MTQTLSQPIEFPDAEADGLIRLPEVALPPDPSAGERARLSAFVLLGYVYVLGVLACFAGVLLMLAAAGAIWPLFAVGAVFVVVLPALRVRAQPPEGVRLTKRNAPRLLELVERQRRQLRAPRLSAVLLLSGPDAFVAQVPRLGVLGWNRIYLGLGLPYLLSFSPEELEAVVAHELAHVARRHRTGTAGIRGSLVRWRQLDERLDERQHWSGRFFRPFLRWYLPRLERAALAASRRNEYEADRAAAAAAGPDVAASMLLRLSLIDRHLDETLWDDVMRRADVERRPPAPFSLMRTAARQELRHRHARLSDVLRQAESDWTHPAIAQRLRAIGVTTVESSRVAPPTATAADVYLDPGLADLLSSFDEDWRSWVEELWSERHDEAQQLRQELVALEAGGDPSPDVERRRAVLVARLDGAAASRRHFERLLRVAPNDPVAHYWVGRALLEAGEERGLDSLAQAVELDVHGTADAAEAAVAFLVDRGRLDEVDGWRARADEYAQRVARAGEERARLIPTDEVEPHGLSAELVELIRAELAAMRTVRCAYLARKRCAEFNDDEPLWVVGVRLRLRGFKLQRQPHLDKLIRDVAERLEPFLGESFWVVVVEGVYAPLEAALEAIPDSRLVGRRPRTVRLRRRAGLRSYAIAAFIVIAATMGLIRLVEGDTNAPAAVEAAPAVVDAPSGVAAWAVRANAACATIRGGIAAPATRAAQAALERELIEQLAAAGSGPGSVTAIRLAQDRLAALEQAIVFEQQGKRGRMAVELRRHDANLAPARALTALGAPACAAP